ncbi:hypothetical protein, partial [Streptomyces sp. NPDC006324]|uniref:hypothetical protein n=1 Tax=Streptomyces sp. NPDC006324 TaxID=3156751 RepID=UPI0033BDF3A1
MSTPLTGPAAASPDVRRQALLENLLRAGGRGARASDTIPRVPRDRPLPLSSAQQRIWLVESLRPGTTEYVVPVGWATYTATSPFGVTTEARMALESRPFRVDDAPFLCAMSQSLLLRSRGDTG